MDIFKLSNLAKNLLSTSIVAATLFGSSVIHAQEGTQAEKEVEQIEVVGKKPLLYFRNQMMKAEMSFYDSVNDYIENPDFKMTCNRERTGEAMRIKADVCMPNYLRNRLAEETQAAINSGKPLPRLEDVEVLVKDQQQKAMGAITKIVEQNPELLEKLVAMHNAKTEYEFKRSEAGFDN